MDRQIVYTGAVPQSIDILNTNKMAQVGLGYALQGILGLTTVVHNLPCTPTVPASLQVNIGVGAIYTLDTMDAVAFGDLGVDQHQIVKQGLLPDPVLLSITPPVTSGQSQVYLVQAILSDIDTGAATLPYYNATNPSAPFSGPGNNGLSQFTARTVRCTIALKAGVAAPTGSQVTPTPDAGYTGLYAITVGNGQTQITSVNIVLLTTAPFFPTLPSVPNGVQTNLWTFCVDTGPANNMAATIYPPVTSLVTGTGVLVKVAAGNTGPATFNLNGLGAQAVHRANGSALASGDYNAGELLALVWDGAAWQTLNFFGFSATTTNNNTFVTNIPYAVDTGTPNAIVATFSPVITSLSAGTVLLVKIANTVTGAATIAVNGLAARALKVSGGADPLQGDVIAGDLLFMRYDGTNFIIDPDPAITANVTLNVPSQFATVTAALNALRRKTIAPTAMVTIQIASGTISPFTVYHTNADRITIQGTLIGALPVASDFVQNGNSFAVRAADSITNLAMLRTRYGTEVVVGSSGIGIQNVGAGQPTIKNILVTGSAGSSIGIALDVLIGVSQAIYCIGVAVQGCSGGFFGGGRGRFDNCSACGCTGYGFQVTNGGMFGGGINVAVGNTIDGFNANAKSTMILIGGASNVNGAAGYSAGHGSLATLTSLSAANNGGSDMNSSVMSEILTSGCLFTTASPTVGTFGNFNAIII